MVSASSHMSEGADDGRVAGQPLLVRGLERLGFGRLERADRLPDWGPLVWFTVGIEFLVAVVLQTYNALTGWTVVFVANPLWLVNLAVLLAAAVGTETLYGRYDRAIERSNVLERSENPGEFVGLVPDWLEGGIIAVGVAFTLANAVLFIGLDQLYAVGGPSRLVRFLVVVPFGWVPVFAAFLSTYASVEVLLPRRLEASAVRLDFLDPERLGGMRPFGELVKLAYYYLMAGLVAVAVATYGPYILDGVLGYEALDPPGTLVNAAFTAIWAAAVLTMAYGIYVLHRFMRVEKREALQDLDRHAREILDERWDVRRFDPANPPDEYETYRQQVEYVRSTKEYPATFTMWTQLAVGVMLPKAIQLVLAGV